MLIKVFICFWVLSKFSCWCDICIRLNYLLFEEKIFKKWKLMECLEIGLLNFNLNKYIC